MKDLFNILIENTKVLEKLGFEKISTKSPEKNSFGISWRHDSLNLNFNIYWSRMEMLQVTCSLGEVNKFNWFYNILEESCIMYDKDKLSYPIQLDNQFNKTKFTETLDYNLKKLGELLMVI